MSKTGVDAVHETKKEFKCQLPGKTIQITDDTQVNPDMYRQSSIFFIAH